jgi:hypothetical protein
MTTDPNESNPYSSPLASCNLIESTNASVHRLIRWRVIPVTLLCIFGVFLIFGGLFMLGLGLWRIDQDKNPLPELGTSIFVVPGFLFLYAGWNIWKGPRLRALCATLLALASYLGCAAIATHFGW